MCNIANNSDKTIIISVIVNFIDTIFGIIDTSNESKYPLKINSSDSATKNENIKINIIFILLKPKYLSYFFILFFVDFKFVAIFISKNNKKKNNVTIISIETISNLKIKRFFNEKKKLFLKMNIGIIKRKAAIM